MEHTLDYILDNVMYDMVIDNEIKYHGNMDYICSHIADGITNIVTLSDNQPADLKEFVANYRAAKEVDAKLTLADYYKSMDK